MTSQPVLLLGSRGQVGWELQRSLAPLGPVVAINRTECNLADLDAVRGLVRQVAPIAIVNAAAYTAVDAAETDEAAAHRINTELPRLLAAEAGRLESWLVHYSTDYVFDGEKAGAYQESDDPAPLSVYGQTKLLGEFGARGCARHLVLRTSWVFGEHGGNFLKTMLRAARIRNSLNVVDDQVGAPTSARLIADVTAHTLHAVLNGRGEPGLYHLASSGYTSWCGYARQVLAQAQQLGAALTCGPDNVHAIAGADWPTAARRPINSRLDTARLSAVFGLSMPSWESQVSQVLQTLLNRHESP